MKILKFGGSSVANADSMEKVCQIIRTYYEAGETFAVVVSALGGVTDQLIQISTLAAQGLEGYAPLLEEFQERHRQMAVSLIPEGVNQQQVLNNLQNNHEVLGNLLYGIFLVREASLRTMDYVLSFGERNAAYLLANILSTRGIHASYLDARKIVKTDKTFGAAKVDFAATNTKTAQYFQQNPGIQIVTGFVASAKGGLTTTLGRGGSDYTAAILASALDAERIEIWTDVDGVLTADPRKVKQTFTIPNMTYAEAMEMAHFGAKVIYPPTIQPALKKNIPLCIKNTFRPDFEGTLVTGYNDPTSAAVKGISSISKIALLTLSGSGLFGVPGIAGRLFSSLANAGINIILITQGSSEHSISFAIDPVSAKKAAQIVEQTFEYEIQLELVDPLRIEKDLSVVAIIGENMRYRPGIAGRMFEALGKNGINAIAIAQGSSELNISVVIQKKDEEKALNVLHQAFFASDKKILHVFMVGVGLIGSTLIDQIRDYGDRLSSIQGIQIRVVGMANSKRMLFDAGGIELSTWKTSLAEHGIASNMPGFVQTMKEMNLSNTIFLDNTANQTITHHYEDILNASISICTPNKIATSSGYAQYIRLKRIAQKRGVGFLYETNVGAGLPVLTTLRDLLNSGDELLEIQGVLSGSLSYLFNTFQGGLTFSETLQKAMALGLTEPDPRVDLSGLDVCRKLVILAREAGGNISMEDVSILGFLPEALVAAGSVEVFLEKLPAFDATFEALKQEAESKNRALRFIATWTPEKATIELASVGVDNPFYNLSGSDNMIVFKSRRYAERPLVIRGPGAGADVTAAGVFAEIVQVGNYLSQ